MLSFLSEKTEESIKTFWVLVVEMQESLLDFWRNLKNNQKKQMVEIFVV